MPYTNAEGAIIAGAYTLGNIPEKYFKYDMDRLGKLIVITRGTTRFLQFLNVRYADSRRTVNSFEPRTHEIKELPRVIPIVANSSSGEFTVAYVSNLHASMMQPNDLFFVKGIYHSFDGTNHVYSTSFSPNTPLYEVVMVVSVGERDSGGSGVTKVLLRRGIVGTPAGNIAPAPSNPPLLTTSHQLVRMGNAFPHGSDAPSGYFQNPEIDGNFLQEFKWAIEVTKEANLEETFLGNQKPKTIQQQLLAKQIAWDIERAFLHGRKAKTYDSRGNPQYFTGGVIEFIPPENYIQYQGGSTLTWTGLNKTLQKLFELGGSESKVAFVGLDLFTALQNMFWDKVMIVDTEKTEAFDIPVYKIVGGSGSLSLTPSYGMQEAGWTDKAIVLDLSGPYFNIDTMEGYDLKYEENIQLPGQQIEKSQYIAIKGLQRRAKQYHAVLYGFPL